MAIKQKKEEVKEEKKKHAGGRPTKYQGQKTVDMVQEYIKTCVDEFSPDGRKKVRLPTAEGLSIYIGVNVDTLYEWSKNHQEFSDSFASMVAEQKKRLIQEGLANNYNPTIAKLILSSNHGMRERTDNEISGKDGQPIEQSIKVTYV